MPEQIGKVFKTDEDVNNCECGQMVVVTSYIFAPEKKMVDMHRLIVGICKCGNTFIKNK